MATFSNISNIREVMKMFPHPDSIIETPNVIVTKLPLIGRVQIVKDVMGMLQICFVLFYWVYGTCTSFYIIILPQFVEGRLSALFMYSYLTVSFLCLASLIRASTLNPGRIPDHIDESAAESQNWTFCHKCNRKRPLRAHHCRRCGQCVMRMDHHCPWINNCVGEDNHYAFFLLLLYAFLLSSMSFILCMLHFWVYPKCERCNHDAFYIKHSIWFLYLLVVLAVNMALMMGIQLIGQHFNLIIDKTTLENMQNPLDPTKISFRSILSSYEELCGGRRSTLFLWFLPCRKRKVIRGISSSMV